MASAAELEFVYLSTGALCAVACERRLAPQCTEAAAAGGSDGSRRAVSWGVGPAGGGRGTVEPR